jgi:hypothetical protein
MNELLIELVKQAPVLAGLIVLVWMFQLAEEKRERQRVENAKLLEDKREAHETNMETKRQTHDSQMNNMWASYIKSIIDQQNESIKALMELINDHETSSQRRYERMGITKELIDAVKAQKEQKGRGSNA